MRTIAEIIEVQKDTKLDDKIREVRDPYGYIYISTNLVNGRRYLGLSTFKKGWEKYLGSGKAFKKALKKYGKENFSKAIIHICYSEDELNTAEYELSVFFDVVESPDWYNMVLGGGSVRGYHFTIEQRRKLSEAKKGFVMPDSAKNKLSEFQKQLCSNPEERKRRSERTKKRYEDPEERRKSSEYNKGRFVGEKSSSAKPVAQYDLDGNFIRRWACVKDVERELNIDNAQISGCCRGIKWHNSAGGYQWRYIIDGVIEHKIDEVKTNKKAVVQLTKDKHVVNVWESLSSVKKETGISDSHISQCCNNKRKSAGGYIWFYVNDAITLGYITEEQVNDYLNNVKQKGNDT